MHLIIDGSQWSYADWHGADIATDKSRMFLNRIRKVTDKYPAESVSVCWDAAGDTFRHKLIDGYKAGRRETDPELFTVMDATRALLKSEGYANYSADGYEADDLIATLTALTDDRVLI